MTYKFYEIITDGTPSDLIVGNTGLREIVVGEQQAQLLLEEAKQWELIRDIKGYEELYWHNDDICDDSSIESISEFYRSGIIIRDGRFYGVLVHSKDTYSSGVSDRYVRGVGLVCIDGFHDGKTTEYETHSSGEVHWEHTVTYYLREKPTEESNMSNNEPFRRTSFCISEIMRASDISIFGKSRAPFPDRTAIQFADCSTALRGNWTMREETRRTPEAVSLWRSLTNRRAGYAVGAFPLRKPTAFVCRQTTTEKYRRKCS